MFVDASAICAILLEEPEAPALLARLDVATSPMTSSLALYEATLAIARAVPGGLAAARANVTSFAARARLAVVSIGAAEGEVALDAFDRYGKGRHPARLNMGDCFAYACARTHGVPLLYKGEDFDLTDLASS
jgi:ribonuclease VapC